MQRCKFMVLPFTLTFLLLFSSACANLTSARPTLAPLQLTSTLNAATLTPMPTFTPTPAVLGSAERPFVLGIVSAAPSSAQQEALNQLAADLAGSLQVSVQARIFSDYIALELALQRSEVHLVWLMPVEYLLASQKNLADVMLVTNHLGVTGYGVQFIGHSDSHFTPYFDVATNAATGTAAQALAQFAGLRPCLTNTKSLSGYWVPSGYLAINNISVKPAVQTYSTNASLRALYIKGVCDFTATYAIAADPRTSSEVITDLPDAVAKLPIIWISPPVIPTLSLSTSPEVDLTVKTRLAESLQALARTEEGKNLLTSALAYETAGLQPLPDSAYDELRQLISVQNVRLLDLLPIE